jgi:hypothetical protein
MVDVDYGFLAACGLAVYVPDAIKSELQRKGINLDFCHGNATWLLPKPATYIVDRTGCVKQAFTNPDHPLGVDPAELVAALRRMMRRMH